MAPKEAQSELRGFSLDPPPRLADPKRSFFGKHQRTPGHPPKNASSRGPKIDPKCIKMGLRDVENELRRFSWDSPPLVRKRHTKSQILGRDRIGQEALKWFCKRTSSTPPGGHFPPPREPQRTRRVNFQEPLHLWSTRQRFAYTRD